MTVPAPKRTLPPRPNPARRRRSKLGRLGTSTLGPLFPLAIVVLFFAAAEWFLQGSSNFFSLANTWQISIQTAVVAIGALGMTVVIIAGGIDLSVGNALALVGRGAGLGACGPKFPVGAEHGSPASPPEPWPAASTES